MLVLTKVEELLVLVLGRKGTMHGSKSLADPLTIHNSNVVVDNEILWYGDVNIKKQYNTLLALAKMCDIVIKVYSESPVRQFCFTDEEVKNKKKAEAEAIAKATPVWTTSEPNKYGGMDIEEAFKLDLKRQQENILHRRIAYGILTPNGTEWTFFNRPYYKYIHAIYRVLKGNFEVFVKYPLERIDRHPELQNLTMRDKIKMFITYFKDEVGYCKDDIPINNSTWKSLLITRWL